MKKVLLAFDGCHFSNEVFEFVKQMNENQKVLATAVFLPSVDYVELLYSFGGVPSGPLYIAEAVKGDDKILKSNVERFGELCRVNGIEYKIHTDFTEHVVSQVQKETRFADLLVLSSKSFYENLGVDTQEDYIANVLHKAECPVVLIPDEYRKPQNIIMAYDGSEQSIFAIKQFAYIFPEFHSARALLVYLESGEKPVPDREHIEEFAAVHFHHLTISKLKIDTKKDIEKWIRDNGDVILIAGAYGRSLISEVFRKSFISEIIHDHKIPVFVAHK